MGGTAAQFTAASNQYLSIPDNSALSTGDIDFSFCGWMNINSKTTYRGLASKWEASTNNREYYLGYASDLDRFIFSVSNNGTAVGSVAANTFGAPSTFVWYFVCAWHDAVNNTLNIQVNNSSIDSTAWSTGVFNGSASFNLGRIGGATTSYHDGAIDEVAFYKRVLTAGERAWLYNNGAGRTYTDLGASAAGWYASNYTYSTTEPHAVTSITRNGYSDSFEYDANGNMTCRTENGATYLQTYNTENRIASIAKLASGDCATPGSYTTKWDFTYDGDGTRTATLTTPYLSGQPQTAVLTRYFFGGALETTGASVKKYYSFAGQTIAMKEGTTVQYFLTDHLGSIVATLSDTGTLISQQRYLPFGAPRTDVGTITQTDFGYTGQRKLDSGMGGIMDYKARFYSPYINRFLQPDTLIPGPENPQSWNRYSYTFNNPIRYVDPTGHRPLEDDPKPPLITYNKEHGLCINLKKSNCTGGESYKRWHQNWWKNQQLPRMMEGIDKVADAIGFGIDTKDYWTSTRSSPKIGFGLDVATQLIKDSERSDLSWEQRLSRAGINGVEGLGISAISAKVATTSSEAILAPSISLAVKTKQPWIPPVAVVLTWVTTYAATNFALSYASDKANENVMPDLFP
jgi:RHS repeat-associated protein